MEIELDDKLQILIHLEKEGEEMLASGRGDPKGQLMQKQLEDLKTDVEGLREELKEQKSVVTEQLAQWKIYQDSLQRVQQWLDEAQETIASGQSRPNTVSEGINIRNGLEVNIIIIKFVIV